MLKFKKTLYHKMLYLNVFIVWYCNSLFKCRTLSIFLSCIHLSYKLKLNGVVVGANTRYDSTHTYIYRHTSSEKIHYLNVSDLVYWEQNVYVCVCRIMIAPATFSRSPHHSGHYLGNGFSSILLCLCLYVSLS